MTFTVDYDDLAAGYDRRYERTDYTGVAEAVSRFVGDDTGLRVLELGCGTGKWIGELSQVGRLCVGLDISLGMLHRAKVNNAPDAHLLAAQAEAVPLRQAVFDRIICINVFHHFSRPEAALAEARRLLRPGGGVMVVGIDPHAGNDRWWIYDYFEGARDRDLLRYPSTAVLRAWMEAAGFERCTTTEAQRWELNLDAREARALGYLDPEATSQLRILTDRQYAKGLQRIWNDVASAEARGVRHELATDLHVYATEGWLP